MKQMTVVTMTECVCPAYGARAKPDTPEEIRTTVPPAKSISPECGSKQNKARNENRDRPINRGRESGGRSSSAGCNQDGFPEESAPLVVSFHGWISQLSMEMMLGAGETPLPAWQTFTCK